MGAALGKTGLREMVSIAVVAYNEQVRIERCLASIAAQSSFDCVDKVIVVDNCSTDDTYNKAHRFISQQSDDRWLFFQTNINSLGLSRNFALQHVQGSEWVCFVDADTELPRQWLEQHLENISKVDDPEALAAVGSVNRLPDDTFVKKAINYGLSSPLLHGWSAQALCPAQPMDVNHIPTANGVFKVSALRKLGGIEALQVGEDFDLGVRLSQAGYKLVLFPGPLNTNDCVDGISDWCARMYSFGRFGGQYFVRSRQIHLPVFAGGGFFVGLGLSAFFYPYLLLLYVLSVAVEAFRITFGRSLLAWFPVIALMVCTHFSYAAGVWVGGIKGLLSGQRLFLSDQHKAFEARLVSVVKK